MPLPTGLKQDQINELLWAQLQTINAVLSSTMPGFNIDLESHANSEIEESTLSKADKEAIKIANTAAKEKHKVK